MKYILDLLKQHWKLDFKFSYYLSVAAFLYLLITANYTLNLDQVIDRHNGEPIRILYYFVLYGLSYGGACFIVFYFNEIPKTKIVFRFLLIALFGLLILSVSTGFPYTLQLMYLFKFNYDYFAWLYQVFNNLFGLLKVFAPLLIFSYWFLEKKHERLGLNKDHLVWRPYLWLLLLVLPLIIIASFETGLKNFYPSFLRYAPHVVNEPIWPYVGIYELSYALDFINVELLFRGFFVIGISTIIGKDAILPMVAVYCSLHFGKPLGETVSSIFGGYILGVIAYYSRNIWGGIMVHVGLAWMMEVVTYLQKL